MTTVRNPVPRYRCTMQLSRDDAFRRILAEREADVTADNDFTVRFLVHNLDPDRTYYYRFIGPDGSVSRIGRTRTAPDVDAKKPVNFAVFSCQHYQCGFFSAYRRLVNEDQESPPDRKIDFVVHLGDFIYESYFDEDSPYRMDLQGKQLKLRAADGSRRHLDPFPSGGEHFSNGPDLARTLEDYRHLYRTYLSDPDLQEARAQFPFVYTWDDHEVINDPWQSYHPSGANQHRKLSGSQAWFEYCPAILTGAQVGPGGSSAAKDFVLPTQPIQEVQPQLSYFDENYLSHEPNNLAVIDAISIYRYLRWGAFVDLFVLDERSYRGPRGVPDGLLNAGGFSGYPSDPIPREVVETLNAGKTANHGKAPAKLLINGKWVDNPRRDYPISSMLGAAQKAWLKHSLKRSNARWKVLANSVPMTSFGFDTSFKGGSVDGVLWSDSWDGYPIERREMATYIHEESIPNVISVSGDRHAHFASLIPSYARDGKPGPAALVEFTGGDTASTSRLVDQDYYTKDNPALNKLVVFTGPKFGYKQKMMPALNAWFLFGSRAAEKLSESGNAKQAMEHANPAVNPDMGYADTDARGYVFLHCDADAMTASFVTIAEPVVDYGVAGPPLRRRVTYRLKYRQAGEALDLAPPQVEGEPPLMGIKDLRIT